MALPKRLRFFLHRDNELTARGLHIRLKVMERAIGKYCPDAPATAKYGDISTIYCFGSLYLLNHINYIDRLFLSLR